MFNNKRRVDAAFAKGWMFGKAVGARDERNRIVSMLDEYKGRLELIETGFGYGNEKNSIRTKTIGNVIGLIKVDEDE